METSLIISESFEYMNMETRLLISVFFNIVFMKSTSTDLVDAWQKERGFYNPVTACTKSTVVWQCVPLQDAKKWKLREAIRPTRGGHFIRHTY